MFDNGYPDLKVVGEYTYQKKPWQEKNMITYEQRVAKMCNPGDEDTQLRLAIKYAKNLRSNAKRVTMLAEKLAINEEHREAEAVVRQLRRNIFDLQDMLKSCEE